MFHKSGIEHAAQGLIPQNAARRGGALAIGFQKSPASRATGLQLYSHIRRVFGFWLQKSGVGGLSSLKWETLMEAGPLGGFSLMGLDQGNPIIGRHQPLPHQGSISSISGRVALMRS